MLDGVPRMRERPIQDLVDGLVQLGVSASCTLGTGCPPVTVYAQGLPSGMVLTHVPSLCLIDGLWSNTLVTSQLCKSPARCASTECLSVWILWY